MALYTRAAALELDTEYVPPPGDPLHHHTAGFAKVLCSAVFITGLDPADAGARRRYAVGGEELVFRLVQKEVEVLCPVRLVPLEGVEEIVLHEPHTTWAERVKEGILTIVPGAKYY